MVIQGTILSEVLAMNSCLRRDSFRQEFYEDRIHKGVDLFLYWIHKRLGLNVSISISPGDWSGSI
jgi:hypothetical protein